MTTDVMGYPNKERTLSYDIANSCWDVRRHYVVMECQAGDKSYRV